MRKIDGSKIDINRCTNVQYKLWTQAVVGLLVNFHCQNTQMGADIGLLGPQAIMSTQIKLRPIIIR